MVRGWLSGSDSVSTPKSSFIVVTEILLIWSMADAPGAASDVAIARTVLSEMFRGKA